MILVVGASSGLGKTLVPTLATRDLVWATYHRSPLGLGLPQVQEFRLDLTSEKEIQEFCARLKALDEKITLVNFAALSMDSLLVRMSLRDWKKTFDVNVHSSFLLAKYLIPKMIQHEWGRLIFVSSVVAETGVIGAAAYSASKSALLGLNKTLAHEYGRFHITSNILMIGYFDQGLIHTLSPGRTKEILKRIPGGRLGSSRNLLEAIGFIQKSDYLNGAVIRLDGGLT